MNQTRSSQISHASSHEVKIWHRIYVNNLSMWKKKRRKRNGYPSLLMLMMLEIKSSLGKKRCLITNSSKTNFQTTVLPYWEKRSLKTHPFYKPAELCHTILMAGETEFRDVLKLKAVTCWLDTPKKECGGREGGVEPFPTHCLNVEVRNSSALFYITHSCPWMAQTKADE